MSLCKVRKKSLFCLLLFLSHSSSLYSICVTVVNLVKIKIRGMYQPLGKGCGRPLHLTSSFFSYDVVDESKVEKRSSKEKWVPLYFFSFFRRNCSTAAPVCGLRTIPVEF